MEAPFTDRSLDKFLKKTLPETATRIPTEELLEQMLTNITTSTSPSVLFVTSNPSSIIVKVLSMQYGHSTNFYVIDSSLTERLQLYGITSSPGLAVVVNAHSTLYEGNIKDVASVSAFLSDFSYSDAPKVANLKDKPHMDKSTLVDIITGTTDVATSAWIVAVYNDKSEAHIEQWDKIASKVQGVVTTGVFKCPNEVSDKDLVPICQLPMPYMLVIPYDSSLKKKVIILLFTVLFLSDDVILVEIYS